MKRFATLFDVLMLAAGSASATVLLSEGFTYPNGNLTPNGGWASFSGTIPIDIQVSAGRAVVDHNNSADDARGFPAQLLTDSTYACFDVIVPPFAGPPRPTYFAMLKDAGTSNFVSRVYVLPFQGPGGGITFGISHSSTSATVGVTAWTAPITAGQRYNIVINYNPVLHTSRMWVDPVNESSPSVVDINANIAALAVSTFALRQSAGASTLPPPYVTTGTIIQVSVDNLGVGSNFQDSCSQYHAVPTTHSTWGSVESIYR
jgi:hypothetical protein